MKNRVLCLALISVASFDALAAKNTVPSSTPTEAKKPRYKGQQVDFEQMLVQGQIRRPEMSVVTGNLQQGSDGLLRLRKNFADRLANDAGEEL